ncbi:MAG: hypothetical protein AAGJ19_02820 [Myxococcota bacterium]
MRRPRNFRGWSVASALLLGAAACTEGGVSLDGSDGPPDAGTASDASPPPPPPPSPEPPRFTSPDRFDVEEGTDPVGTIVWTPTDAVINLVGGPDADRLVLDGASLRCPSRLRSAGRRER